MNSAIEALNCAVNRAIAEGSPIYVNQPDCIPLNGNVKIIEHVVQPEVPNDNFDADDFGALGEEMEDEEEILGNADADYDPRNPDDN